MTCLHSGATGSGVSASRQAKQTEHPRLTPKFLKASCFIPAQVTNKSQNPPPPPSPPPRVLLNRLGRTADGLHGSGVEKQTIPLTPNKKPKQTRRNPESSTLDKVHLDLPSGSLGTKEEQLQSLWQLGHLRMEERTILRSPMPARRFSTRTWHISYSDYDDDHLLLLLFLLLLMLMLLVLLHCYGRHGCRGALSLFRMLHWHNK